MVDFLTKAQRSRLMSTIRGHTKPELLLRRALWKFGIRYRIKSKLIGQPDIVISRYRFVVFVDGCFWHGCPLHFKQPQTNKKFWANKIRSNRTRDKRVVRELIRDGWQVLRIWEHDLQNGKLEVLAKKLVKRIKTRRTRA